MNCELHHLFDKTAHIHFHTLVSLLRKQGINISPHVLITIEKYNGLTQNELAKHLENAPASVTTILSKLEKENYIYRLPDDKDLRKNRIYITDAGLNALNKMRLVMDEINYMCFHNFTETETVQFKELLEKLYNNINK